MAKTKKKKVSDKEVTIDRRTKDRRKTTAKKKTAKKKASPSRTRSTKKKATTKASKAVEEKEKAVEDREPKEVELDVEVAAESEAEQSDGTEKAPERRKVQRRRQIDPTTCERDYTDDEIEFMHALDEYKRANGRMFPTCSEVLEVVRNLGYVKMTVDLEATTANSELATLATGTESTDDMQEDEAALESSDLGAPIGVNPECDAPMDAQVSLCDGGFAASET